MQRQYCGKGLCLFGSAGNAVDSRSPGAAGDRFKRTVRGFDIGYYLAFTLVSGKDFVFNGAVLGFFAEVLV
jgi:hypothetical protein